MKTPNHRRPGNKFRLIRWFPFVAALLVAAGCGVPSVATNPAPLTPASTAEVSADHVGEALSEVSLQLSAQMTGGQEDLILAWSDFEGDIRSVVHDLVHRPSRVDIEGMQQRVEGLEEFLEDSVVELPKAEWDEFTSAFQTLIEEVSASTLTVLE